jgi:outer membrane protein assembly factor BamB
VAAVGGPELLGTSWTHVGGGAAGTGGAPRLGGVDWSEPLWTRGTDEAGRAILFNGPASPVVHAGRVYVPGLSGGQDRLFCVEARTGAALWSAALAPLALDSWSSPALDVGNGTVLVASGSELVAIDGASGARRWTRALGQSVVNASPAVTHDRGPRDRAFVTDYSYAGVGNGRLICVNVDPFDAVVNPYAPGQIVWAAALPGETSGATPAYDGTRVYVACTDASGRARVLAFDAGSTAAVPTPVWTCVHAGPGGAFGGVSVRGGHVYAATFAFNAGQLNSRLMKIRAVDGALVWSVASGRSASIPVPLADGRVVLSAGVPPDPVFGDFGSRPSVQVFSASGALLFDTAVATWVDADGDGVMDEGEYVRVGGWNTHPVVSAAHAGVPPRVVVGRIGVGGAALDPYEGLVEVTLGVGGASGAWGVTGMGAEGGSSAAAVVERGAGPMVFSVGPGGLSAFGGGL